MKLTCISKLQKLYKPGKYVERKKKLKYSDKLVLDSFHQFKDLYF